jgi:CheY-like chemotaxis protein
MKILVVEDNPLSAKLVEGILAAAGYDTVWAASGERALTTLSRVDDIDLVICDMGLPGISGLELVARIRKIERAESLPVIMCTAYADPQRVEAAVRSGCVGYLLKPVKPGELLSRVRSVLGSQEDDAVADVNVADPSSPESTDAAGDADSADASSPEIDTADTTSPAANAEPVVEKSTEPADSPAVASTD